MASALVGFRLLGLATASRPRSPPCVARQRCGVPVPYIMRTGALYTVGEEGLEPSRIAPYASETYAYTSSATRPWFISCYWALQLFFPLELSFCIPGIGIIETISRGKNI